METLKKTSLFWDVKDIDPEKNRQFVIERVLQYGDKEDFEWILGQYGKEAVIESLLKARGLDRKSLFFWCQFFNLDQNKCTAKSSMKTPSAFWKR